MQRATEFKLPELGENIDSGDLVRLLISRERSVSEGQPVMELETDKAVVEVPSSVSGVVREVKVEEGQKVKVGEVIFTLAGCVRRLRRKRLDDTSLWNTSRGSRQRGWRFQAGDARRRQDRRTGVAAGSAASACEAFSMPVQLGKVAGTEHRDPVPAAPHVRRLAREIGVDITR